MIAEIHAASDRPPLFEPSTAPFWDDPYIASRFLEAHLDSGIEAASRPGAVVGATVARLVDRGLAGLGRRVLDLGCGPGLCAHRLAAAGCAVTGLDLSPGSIEYARRRAAEDGLATDFCVQGFCVQDLCVQEFCVPDFRTPDEETPDEETPDEQGRYDVGHQSYGEMATFPDGVRDGLSGRMRDALAPGGVYLFDVTTPAAHRGDVTRRVDLAHGGLWRPGPHVVVSDRFDYPDDVTCDQYVVADDERGVQVYRRERRQACTTPRSAEMGRRGL